jgi:hypothetical protein
MLRLLPAPPVAAPTTGLPSPPLRAEKAVAGWRPATPAVTPTGLGSTPKPRATPAAAMDRVPAHTPGAVPSSTDAPATASRSEPSAAPGNAARPLDLRWRGGGGLGAGPSGTGPRLPTPSAAERDAPPSQSPEARLARALDPGTARSEQRLAGEGRTRVRIGRDCLDVKDARSAQLDPFNQSQQNTPRLVSDCSR